MRITEIARVQEYLRTTLSNNRITIKPPLKVNAPIEVYIGDEFIGVLHKDEEEGEVSYTLMMTILDIDLPSIGDVPISAGGDAED